MKNNINNSRKFIYVLMLLAIVASYFLLREYFLTIVFSLILGYLFRPLHVFFLQLTGNHKAISTLLSLLAIALLVLVPVFIASVVVLNQVLEMTRDAEVLLRDSNISIDYLIRIVDDLNRSFPGLNIRITQQDIVNYLLGIVRPLSSSILNYILQIGSSIISIMVRLILFVSITSVVINKYPELIVYLKKLSPFPEQIDNIYLSRIQAMTTSMTKGIFIIALVQGAITGFSMALVGVPYVFLWSILATLFSIIPLGSGFIAIPIALLVVLAGNPLGGLFVLAVNILIVSNVDNILRPRLAAVEARLDPVLTLIGFLGGLELFGFLGVVIGPIMMIFIATTFEVYIKYYTNNQLEKEQ